ncbi:MAG: PKD domain-containing protein [Candidatus Thiodiazotropha sp. (ex Codakia orbicularis)]|nr:PKD domain-containing protein [Candidatus Thiodiazotropha sp. (ex Codakia orbicularis)]
MLKYPARSFSSLSFTLLIFICLSVGSNKTDAALIVNAGPDQVVTAGTQVQLDGTGSSETDGTIASYHWFQVRGPVVTLAGSRTAVSSFQAPANAELEFVLRLVSDTNEVATDRVVILTDPYTNISPLANAGIDQSVSTGELVQLDGTASSDTDGMIAKYRWYQKRGPAVQLSDTRSATPSFQAPPNAQLAFTLKVEDDAGAVATDSVEILVEPYTNQSPVSVAGDDLTVNAGDTVTLDGSASSDADGTIVQYIWKQNRGPSVALQNARTPISSFVMPADAELVFTLSVIDDSGAITRDSIVVRSTTNNNQPPNADAGADQTVAAGETVQLDGSASSDADGAIVSYNWRQNRGPSVVLQDARTAAPSFVMPADAELAFTLSVTDDSGAITRDSVVIHSAVSSNQPPNADAGADQTVAAGETVQLDGSASSDADGTIVSYNWRQNRGPSVVLQNARTVAPNFLMPADAELAFTLSVTDDSGAVTRDFIVVRSAINNNQPPLADAGIDQTVVVGEIVQLNGGMSSDPDGSIVKYIWRQISGESVQLDNNNSAAPTFTAAAPGEIVFRLYVEDNNGSRTPDEVLVNVVIDSNLPPVAVAGPDGSGVEGRVFTMDANQSSDPDGSISTYLWEQISGPVASVLSRSFDSPRVGILLPDVTQDTPIIFRLTVTDDQGSTATDEITIHVLENLPPDPIPTPAQTVVEGDYHVMDATALFQTQPLDSIKLGSYRWRQISGPPVTLQYRQYREQARILVPNVESATPLVFEITANDQRGLIGRNTITLNVIRQEDMPANILPQARAGVDHVSTNHKYIIVDGSGSTDPDGEIVSYSWEVIDTPDSISYTPSFRGDSRYPTNHTVSTNAPGVYTIRLTVTDDRGGVSTDDVVITLEPSIVVGTVPSANTGYDRSTSPYYFNLGDSQSLTGSASTDSDGYIASYYWQQISGPKIDIANPTSVNTSFTPQFIQEYVRYRFLLTVTDDQGNQHNDEMNWYIRYTNSLPRPSLVQRDLIGLSGATLQLDGSGSYDDDNYIQTFNWTQTTGLDVVFLDYSAEPLIQLPELDPANGLARVKIGLTVTDLDGAESVIIDEENFWALHPDYQAGTIYAGADLIVQSGDQVELLGESLEPECNPISGCVDYSDHMSWIQLDGPGVINPVSSGWSYSFVAPDVLERTTLILAMAKVVTQGLFGRIVLDADPIEIIVLPAGEGLTSNAGSDQSLPEFSQTVLDGSSSTDPHGFITRYEWMQISGPDALISDSNSSITDVLLPTVSVESILDFQLTVTNDIGLQAIDMVTIIVQPDYNDGDYDGDGIPDTHDSFPDNHNEAYDFDSDGLSDSEDVDKDGDGINNDVDFYPNDPSLQSPPEITILSPINNSDVENSYVIVRGTLNAPPNTGVTVNDIVAEIAGDPYGSEFSARVPLEMGVNELVITVTPVSHKQVTQTLSVNRTGDIPFRLFVSHRNGIDEIVNRLNIVNKGSDSILQIDVDYEGNGSVDEVLLDNFEMDINHTYSIEGIYYPQVVVTDANGNQYTLTQLVNVVSTERINQLLQEQWAAMNIALAGMNHGLATDYLIEYERDAYGEMFYLLLPQFPGIISSYSALQPITLTYKYASYLINRDVDGIDRAFVVTYLRDVYGVWRLAGL